ncbi:hypothetical protein DXA09_21385 [Absiella sp. AM54-8XD]|uniref:AHH domain-containing protein n=1 Tax=[Eubacterium] hominis TaxID=2764325 RepID=A0A7G9GTU4_9FIRM|nr:AHH domain-containing protein [[Eubacterium] hominis]RGB49785.1 hypothetical protein DW271_17800 [Absiella sp. AM22-9]RGB53212.1 hypothetical protein DW120_19560 [Absiella sp. AM10-20]RGB64125.1 hypothetical protein DW113_16415 [Absiella sp. AM09-45]RGB72939.1 hypothetical protein DW114_17190 [Absiella sp. AM09-50]RGC14109.1 hypothetical protein DXA09_21385 [Absiella sp. AM54-8XD]RHT99420.1 hypothetical protein DW716_20945 [Absiella sp. AM27-20]
MRNFQDAHPTKPVQIHHFASNKSKVYTPQFELILQNYEDLDLDGEWNKEPLHHQGRHPNDYHDFVLQQMKDINLIAQGNSEIFKKEFESRVKDVIRNKEEMLYSAYWKKLKSGS